MENQFATIEDLLRRTHPAKAALHLILGKAHSLRQSIMQTNFALVVIKVSGSV